MDFEDARKAWLASVKPIGKPCKPRPKPLEIVRNRSIRDECSSTRSSHDLLDPQDRLDIWFDWDWYLDSERWDDSYSLIGLHPSWSPSATGSDSRSFTHGPGTNVSYPTETALILSSYPSSTSRLLLPPESSSQTSSASSSGISSILARFPMPAPSAKKIGANDTSSVKIRRPKRSKTPSGFPKSPIRSLKRLRPMSVFRSMCKGKQASTPSFQMFAADEMLPLSTLSYESRSESEGSFKDEAASSVSSQTAKRLWAVGKNVLTEASGLSEEIQISFDEIFTGYTTLPTKSSREDFRVRCRIDTFHEALAVSQ